MKMNTLICSNLDIRHHKIYFKIYFLFVLRIITWKFPRFCISIQIVHAISVCTAQRAQPKYNFSHYFFVDLSLRLIPGVFQPLEFINQRISKIFYYQHYSFFIAASTSRKMQERENEAPSSRRAIALLGNIQISHWYLTNSTKFTVVNFVRMFETYHIGTL